MNKEKTAQINAVIELLRVTLGEIPSRQADRIVTQCINLLEIVMEDKK